MEEDQSRFDDTSSQVASVDERQAIPETNDLHESFLSIKKEAVEEYHSGDVVENVPDENVSNEKPFTRSENKLVSKPETKVSDNFDQFWMLVRPRVLKNLSLWSFLAEKSRFHETSSSGGDEKNISKLQFLLEELDSLLNEVSQFVRDCFQLSTNVDDETSMKVEQKISAVLNLYQGVDTCEELFLKCRDDVPAVYRKKIFDGVLPSEIEDAQEESNLSWFSEYMTTRMLKVKLEEHTSNPVEDDLDHFEDKSSPFFCEDQESLGLKRRSRRKKSSKVLSNKRRLTKVDGHLFHDEDSNPDDDKDGISKPGCLTCKACYRSFDKKKSFAYHLKRGRCPGKPEPKKLHKVISNRYYCTHPDCLSPTGNVLENVENFSTRNNYFKHYMERHCKDSDLVFSCEICSARFPFQELYKIHFKSKHDKQFTCRFCGQSFAEKRTLEKHERRHTGEKPYKCDRCEFRCNSSSSLCLHKRRKHDPGEKGRVHVCEQCGKGFFTRDNLKDHIATHSDIKLFSCYICGKGLKNDSCYRRHMVCVHGQKFTCEVCSKDFSSKFGVDNHKREVHGILY